ncbi:hypothetical protein V8F06_010737 [Rhypophila decipiens]
MSLGVRHLWRFRRHASLAPRVSLLIPRELPYPVRSFWTAAASTAPYSSPASSPRKGPTGLCDEQHSNGETSEQSSGPFGIAVNMAIETAAEASAVSSHPFFERLSKLPICTEEIHAPVVVKRPTNYTHHREINRELHRSRKTLIQHELHSKRAEEMKLSESGDWRSILGKLKEITPMYTPVAGSFQVLVPEESVHLLTEDRTNNIWAIKSRTGCALQLHRKNPHDPQDSTYLLVTGEKSGIHRAIRDFLDLCQHIKVTHLTQSAAANLRREVSPVLSPSGFTRPKKYYLSKGLDDIEKPEQWTMATFEHYIITLIESRLPAGLHYELGYSSHARRVVWALLDVFHDPATESAMSLVSFKLALRYISSWGDGFWAYARVLVGVMISRGFELDSEIYDHLARMAVKVNKMGHFQYIVNQMAKNEHRPSLQTWIHFLRLVKDERIRRHILQAMDSKGLLNHPYAMRELATELVEHDIKRALQDGLGIGRFVASQNDLYGPQWLHWRTSNRVLGVLGGYGRFDLIDEFLTHIFDCPNARPENEVALNIILTHCKNQRKIDAAVGFVKRFEQELELGPPGILDQGKAVPKRTGEAKAQKMDYITYHLLTEIAYRLKKPHTFSVLCRHSYLQNHTSRRMTIRLFELTTIKGSPRQRLRSFLGRLKIAGTLPKPKKGVRDEYQGPVRFKSDQLLVLAMQNLLLCDYKEAHGIGQDKLLTDEEVQQAVRPWYRHKFGDEKKGIDKLGNILDRALQEDRKDRAESHLGKEIILRPVPLTKPVPLKEPLKHTRFLAQFLAQSDGHMGHSGL